MSDFSRVSRAVEAVNRKTGQNGHLKQKARMLTFWGKLGEDGKSGFIPPNVVDSDKLEFPLDNDQMP